jgi:hypothetical protein
MIKIVGYAGYAGKNSYELNEYHNAQVYRARRLELMPEARRLEIPIGRADLHTDLVGEMTVGEKVG